jgi:hypothetical protein
MNGRNKMKIRRSSAKQLTWILAVSAGLLLTGSAALTAPPREAKAPAVPQSQASPVVLEYKMTAGQVLKYQDKSEMRQTSDFMGQSVETSITSTGAYSFQAKGRREANYRLNVTIDDSGMVVKTPRGDMSPDMKPVIGKSLDMVLSPLGKEVEVTGAEGITYELAGSQRNAATFLKIFFPDLPGTPVKIGDSWPSYYVIEETSGGAAMRLEFKSVNTLEGWETAEGMECVRIAATVTGTISGKGKQQGMDTSTDGKSKGKDVWYFAVKEGIFVKAVSELTTEMTTALTGGQSVTIPTTQTRTSEVKLVAR